jgi:Zn-dependent alcohol dehydrogenase
MYMQGQLKLDEMVSRRGRLEDVNLALEDQRAHRGTRTVLLFN